MLHAFIDELKEIKSSFYLLGLLTWIPFVSFLIVISIFHKGVATKLPISIVDNDRSRLSTMVINQINATSTLHVKQVHNNLKEASLEISSGNIYATVVIPNNFQKDTLQNKNPKITAFINSQYLLIAKMINSTLRSTIAQNAIKVDVVSNLIKSQNIKTAISLSNPINVQITPFFNTHQNYFLFLVSAIIPALWQILIVIAILSSFGKSFKLVTIKEQFKDGIFVGLVGKTLPYTIGYFAWGIAFILYMYGYEGWEFQGSFAITFLAMFITILAYEGIALTFFVLNFNPIRALSLAAIYTAPAFAFLGVTFPLNSMPEFATFWHNLLPISHYIKIQISQASYGIIANEVLPLLFNLLYFLPLWLFVYIKMKKAIHV